MDKVTLGIIAGVILATLTGVLIPFLTSQFSLWTEQQRETQRVRREALSAYVAAKREVTRYMQIESARIRASGAGGSVYMEDADHTDVEVARDVLLSHFTTSDNAVRECFTRYAVHGGPEDLAIVSTWAAGHNRRAKRAVKHRTVGAAVAMG